MVFYRQACLRVSRSPGRLLAQSAGIVLPHSMDRHKHNPRSFRLRPSTLAALKAAAGEHDVSPNRLCEVILQMVLAAWLTGQLREQREPQRH